MCKYAYTVHAGWARCLGRGEGGVLGWYLPTLLKLPGSVFVIRSTSARQTGVEAYLVGKSRKSEQ